MPEYSAGSASVRIRPNADDFIRDLQRQLASTKDPGFSVTVNADVVAAARDTKEWREKEERDGVDVDVDADTAGATAEMEQWRQRQEARPIQVNVEVNTRGADRALNQVNEKLQRFQRSDSFKLNLGAFALGAIQPAVTGLVQVAAALQQVSGAALVVPGAVAGAAASIGTLAIGLGGVGDAYSAVSKAAASSGTDQAAAARTAAAASNALRNAVVDESQARKDQANAYRDARQQLQDLNVEMRGGLISESRALLEATKAREDLAKGNYSDVRDAQLRVLEADQRILEVRSRNAKTSTELNDAQAKGVAGSDLVVAANERVVRSEQAVADAQAGAAAAAGGASAAAKAAQQAMDKLSPSAQRFVDTLVEMSPLFSDFRDAAQEPLFEGKAEEFRKFFGDMAPLAQRGMSRISAAWNDNITALVTTLSSGDGQSMIDRILGNTGEAQEKLSKAIDPLIMGIGTLAAAGTDALPRLSDALGNASARFANFITEADADGRLDRWINDGLTGMTSLGESALNIGKSISSITSAAGGGGSFLQWLETTTGKWRDWLASTEGQSKVKEWLEQGLDLLQMWGNLLKELPGAFQSMSNAVQPYIGAVIGLFKTLAELIGDHPDLVMTAVTAYLTFKTVSPVIGSLQTAMGTLSTIVTNLGTGFYPVRDNAKKAMSEVDDTFKKAGNQGSGLNKFSSKLAALGTASAGAGIIGALASIAIPGLVLALGKLDEANQRSAEKTDYLNTRQMALEETLDRVTGKLTDQSVQGIIANAQNFDPGGAGGGIPGISQGNGITAAKELGIPEDVYTKALTGDQQAVQQVKDVIRKNNVAPEFAANSTLSGDAAFLEDITGGSITQDKLIAALLADPKAVEEYTAALAKAEQGASEENLPRISGLDLSSIAQRLSPTGQASVLASSALETSLATLPDGGLNRQAQAAQFGAHVVKPGSGAPFPDNAQVDPSGTDFKVTVPKEFEGQLIMQGIQYIVNPGDGSLTATVAKDSPFIMPAYEQGGPTHDDPGARFAVVHPKEFMLSQRGRASVPDSFLHKLNQGIVDPRELGSFEPGGLVDEYGNPAQPGAQPGPLNDSLPIAPNPTAPTSGGLSSVFGQVVSGLQGPIGNALALGQQIGGMVQSAGAAPGAAGGAGGATHGLGSSLGAPLDPGAAFATRAASLPGLAGLIGSASIADPAMSQAALTNWGSQTAQWVGNWGLNTASKTAGILWQGGLGAVGLENSVLSSTNPWNQAASSAGGFFMNADGPLGTLMGVGGKSGGAGSVTDPASLAAGYGVTLDDAMLQAIYGGGTGGLAPGEELPAGVGPEGGLQVNTIRAKRAISAAFPQITEIGGVRDDPKPWHPNGLAIDVMIPGQGGNNDPTTPEGLALGNKIYAYIMANKDRFGVDYVMWQEKDHYNHLHVNTTGGGYPGENEKFTVPGMASGGPTPSTTGTVDSKGGHLAVVHPNEFMISARGRASVPDGFLHKLNKGMVDPKDLPGYLNGGPARTAAVIRPLPPPPPVQARTINPVAPPRAAMPAPAAPPVAAAAPTPGPTAAPVAPTPSAPTGDPNAPVSTPTTTGGAQIAAAPGSTNHNLDAVNTLISSSASNLGQLASTALSIAAMGAGGAGVPGAGAIGAIGPFVAGGIQQGGKIVEGAVNVVSSSLVGNVPGSFGGEPGASPYGRTVRPEQDAPVTSPVRNTTYNVSGNYELRRAMEQLELRESVSAQADLAHHK